MVKSKGSRSDCLENLPEPISAAWPSSSAQNSREAKHTFWQITNRKPCFLWRMQFQEFVETVSQEARPCRTRVGLSQKKKTKNTMETKVLPTQPSGGHKHERKIVGDGNCYFCALLDAPVGTVRIRLCLEDCDSASLFHSRADEERWEQAGSAHRGGSKKRMLRSSHIHQKILWRASDVSKLLQSVFDGEVELDNDPT